MLHVETPFQRPARGPPRSEQRAGSTKGAMPEYRELASFAAVPRKSTRFPADFRRLHSNPVPVAVNDQTETFQWGASRLLCAAEGKRDRELTSKFERIRSRSGEQLAPAAATL